MAKRAKPNPSVSALEPIQKLRHDPLAVADAQARFQFRLSRETLNSFGRTLELIHAQFRVGGISELQVTPDTSIALERQRQRRRAE